MRPVARFRLSVVTRSIPAHFRPGPHKRHAKACKIVTAHGLERFHVPLELTAAGVVPSVGSRLDDVMHSGGNLPDNPVVWERKAKKDLMGGFHSVFWFSSRLPFGVV